MNRGSKLSCLYVNVGVTAKDVQGCTGRSKAVLEDVNE